MAGKKYRVRRKFRRIDPKSGTETVYLVGDTYSGPVNEPYYLDSKGPDGRGALLEEESEPIPAPSTDSATKEN